MTIQYLSGDATYPAGNNSKLIIHICNNKNAWGKGFVLSLSKRWKLPQIRYHRLQDKSLGIVQFVRVAQDIVVANMIAQTLYEQYPPIDYKAVEICLYKVAAFASSQNATIHMPRIGCGLAGSNWDIMLPIINKCLDGLNVFVYDPIK